MNFFLPFLSCFYSQFLNSLEIILCHLTWTPYCPLPPTLSASSQAVPSYKWLWKTESWFNPTSWKWYWWWLMIIIVVQWKREDRWKKRRVRIISTIIPPEFCLKLKSIYFEEIGMLVKPCSTLEWQTIPAFLFETLPSPHFLATSASTFSLAFAPKPLLS